MKHDPLDLKSEVFQRGDPYPLSTSRNCYNGLEFINFIIKKAARFDCMTYNVGDIACLKLPPIHRLLYSTGEVDSLVAQEAKWIPSSHIKLWLVQTPTKDRGVYDLEAYVGSLNLCCPTLHEVIVRVSPHDALHLIDMFEYFWMRGIK